MPLGTEIDIGLDDIVSPYTERGTAAPTFRPMSTVAKRSPISGTTELFLFIVFTARAMFALQALY